jgi:NADH-quinone oxidoreductase subunit J
LSVFFPEHSSLFLIVEPRMQEFFFYLFAAMAIVPALGMVATRNPVNSAMYLILSLLGVAGFFVALETYFLAALQVLVYAGAVVVLFLFIIMLLDVEQTKRKALPFISITASLFGGLILIYGVWKISTGADALPDIAMPADYEGSSVSTFGHYLFGKYMLPFQVAGYLLLVSMIGVIWLSKKNTGASSNASLVDEEGAGE